MQAIGELLAGILEGECRDNEESLGGVPPPPSIVLCTVGAICRAREACMQDKRDRQRYCFVGSYVRLLHKLLLARAEQLRLRLVHGCHHSTVTGGYLCNDGRVRGCAPGRQAHGDLQAGVDHSARGGRQKYCPFRGVSSLPSFCLCLGPHSSAAGFKRCLILTATCYLVGKSCYICDATCTQITSKDPKSSDEVLQPLTLKTI
jgi:hypothetical protein